MQPHDSFEALADRTRRDIVTRLARGACRAGDIAALFPVSRPAVSRHLRILREAGLVAVETTGRERVYRLASEPLSEIRRWVTRREDWAAASLPLRIVPLFDETAVVPQARTTGTIPPAA